MFEREQMPFENPTVKINLVGFNAESTEKLTKQIDTVNHMNMVQNRLKYQWGISPSHELSQAHFVISSTLPSYLNDSQDPILTNQSFDFDNIIPCPYPLTTFDLLDVLVYVEEVLTTNDIQKKQLAVVNSEKENGFIWGANIKSTSNENKSNQIDKSDFKYYGYQHSDSSNKIESVPIETNTIHQSIEKPIDPPIFYAYGSFQKNTEYSDEKLSNSSSGITFNTVSSSSNQITGSNNLDSITHPTSNTESFQSSVLKQVINFEIGNTDTSTSNGVIQEIVKTETFIRYGAFKNSVPSSASTEETENVSALIPQTDIQNKIIEIGSVAVEPKVAQNNDIDIETPILQQDIWTQLAIHTQGIVIVKEIDLYIDYGKNIIHSNANNIQELAQLLFTKKPVGIHATETAPKSLKQFSLSAALWSYGLHHPNVDEQAKQLDLENQEWKLKGFPRFGQWETHPTWLFLATFFAQSPQSIYAAESKGKASNNQIKHFIYAAKLAGLVWQTQALDPIKKEQQQALLQQHELPESASWITRLREKLQINEHFESSLD